MSVLLEERYMKEILKVVICDDETTAAEIISASVEALLAGSGVAVRIAKFTSARECYQYVKRENVDLWFLDIAMPEADGIILAKKILKYKKERMPILIFVSSKQERVFDSFSVMPFGFVRKDHFMKDISEVMGRYVEQKLVQRESEICFEIHEAGEVTVLKAAQILFVESFRKTQTVHLKDAQPVALHSTMDQIYEKLKKYDFIRIYKSYIVNSRQIESFGRNEVLLTSGKRLPVGRAYCRDAMEQYMNFIRENGIHSI